MRDIIGKQNSNYHQSTGACCPEKTRNKNPLIFGLTASLAVIGFYLGLITLVSDWYNAKAQFNDYRWWIVSLAIGLGIQVGLFTYMRRMIAAAQLKGSVSGMATSGGLSGVAMALCCSHYLAGLLPIVGLPFLSAAVAGMEQYQTQFFFVGVISNILGMAYMFWVMSKRGLLPNLYVTRRYRGIVKDK